MQSRIPEMPLGIDVSHWQGDVTDSTGTLLLDTENNPINGIDFNAVKLAGVQFVYVKITDGLSRDRQFYKNVFRSKSAGILTGGYHFARPQENLSNPEGEANNFIDSLQIAFGLGHYGDLMPVLDVESPRIGELITISTEQLLTWVERFKNHFQVTTGVQLMLYTSEWFVSGEPSIPYAGFNDFYGENNPLKNMPLWVAAYEKYGYTSPRDFGGWKSWTVWQYSEDGQIPGISDRGQNYNSLTGSIQTKVDLNIATSIDVIRSKPVEIVSFSIVPKLILVGLGLGAGLLLINSSRKNK